MLRMLHPKVLGIGFIVSLSTQACTTTDREPAETVSTEGEFSGAESMEVPADVTAEAEGAAAAASDRQALTVSDIEAAAPELDKEVEDYAIADYKSFDPSGIMIHFEFNEARLNSQAIAALQKLVRGLKQDPLARISVAGHADKQGPEGYNLSLSEKRAKAIRNYLVTNGIEEDRLNPVYYGESQPIEDGNTIRVFKKNRRGEFTINYGPSAFGK
jgi:outer membrane protein OmpA-like peptidoglycan-associated protein